ncbi:MAG: PAS domain-containing protein [Kiritimatiellae bacterium]|nr:PAS domain-containing protein [Kiritimatiellia bacterium]
MASGFFDRLVSRIDKLDPESLQMQMIHLAKERGFLEAVFQSIQEGLMVIDNAGKLLYANRAAEQITGIDASQRGRSILRTLREWDWEHLLDTSDDVDGWSQLITREVEITYPEHRFISIYAVPLLGQDSPDKEVLVILRDVTRDRQQEVSNLESERYNAIKMLAAGVAHEIGNPLNAITIHLQLLAREIRDLPPESRDSLSELVDVAQTEVSRLDTIISQFLRAVRPAKPVLVPEHPEEVLQDTLRLLKTECENRRIAVSIDIPSSVPSVLLDRSQIKQVFFNLFKNALEAMPDGGNLKVVFGSTDGFVDISIIDNGQGIPTEELGRIFEPYHTTKTKGTGLGLMIVKRIIEDHGGEIEVASKPGAGTCFKIRLPRSERRIRKLSATAPKPREL